ncbi:hypothetical protein E4T56_gene2621 [Termitomyces sp. T112]|nr:hypothetical protein E4T56_gene2621 [Termitomyces sp. T112]
MLGSLHARPNVLGGGHAIFSEEGSQLQSPTTSAFSRSNRERLNDPFVSMLDLDDDPRLSVASDVYDNEQSDDVSLDNSSHRLGYLGPNLRFHSRAPWETDDTTLDNDEELSYNFLTSSKKALGFSSSPRTSNARRPSSESTRSQAKSKQSFETTSSQLSYPRGALYALAQESFSTSSLGIPAAAEKSVRSKTPLNRVRLDSTHNTTLPPSPTCVTHSNHIPLTNSSRHEAQDAQSSASHFTHANDFHPYANPDLVCQVLEEHPHSSPKQGILRNGSIGTVTDSIAYSTVSSSKTRFTSVPAYPTLSENAQTRASAIQCREIFSPISVVNTPHLDSKLPSNEESFFTDRQPVVESLSGRTEQVICTSFSLISLEEARARKRSTTSQPTVALSPPPSSTPLSVMFHPDSHNADSRRYDLEDGDFSPCSQRARARSASAGAKAKVAFQSVVGSGQSKLEADVGHGKTLKHRKSGFMRLFNGGRGQDKEEKSPPPPVPSLSDAYAALCAAQETPKVAAQCNFIPGPSLSLEASLSSPEQTPSPTGVPALGRLSPNPKRPIPSLSINTQSHLTLSAVKNEDFQMRTAPSTKVSLPHWSDNLSPQSAPANVSDFPALKLRPVSTAFSAQFVDHIVLPDCRPSLETDGGTPISPTKIFSPVTPGSASISDLSSTDPKLSTLTNFISQDNSSVISALQEQIINAKLAWQRQIWELESQVRDLKAEVDDLHKAESEGTFCERCGRGQRRPKVGSTPNSLGGEAQNMKNLGVMSRPRALTGSSSRFGNALP